MSGLAYEKHERRYLIWNGWGKNPERVDAVTPRQGLKCNVCGRKFKTIDGFDRHVNEKHPRNFITMSQHKDVTS